MSDFEYYEFQAVDRPLIESEILALRQCSSRALISPTRFVNHYSYGSFKGDIQQWMERYFDAFLYMSNSGARRLILKLPDQLIDTEIVKQYCIDDYVQCVSNGIYTTVEFAIGLCDDSAGVTGWLEEDNDSLTSLLPLRQEISCSDYRLFYLGWLLAVQDGDIASTTKEPPVPLGLGSLSPALNEFVTIFGLDLDLLNSAAASSGEMPDICTDDIEPCVAGLSESEKCDWLCQLALDSDPNLQARFLQAILPESGLEFFSEKPRRTVAEIVGNAKG